MELDENQNNTINILSRNDSAGFSYFRSNEGIPFDWEMKPGIPKHPQQEHHQHQHIPPLTPPPAILNSNLGRSSMSDQPHFFSKPSSSNWSTRLRFWKRNTTSNLATILSRKQTRLRKKLVRHGSREFDSVDGFAAVDQCLSDPESMAMSSSLPFDSSFSVFSSSCSSRSLSPIRGIYGKPLSCFSMHIRKI